MNPVIKPIRKIASALTVGLCVLGATACQDFLDVNQNPNGPEVVSANLYLPQMIHWMATSPQFDGRFVGLYNQEFTYGSTSIVFRNYQRMGYFPGSDVGGEEWRMTYWLFGQNLVDMIQKAQAEQRWDILGAGYLLKAIGWESVTNLHGEIIVKQAFDQTRFSFDYDPQQFVYETILQNLDSAILNLQRTDGAVDRAYFAVGDKMYNGDRAKWLKFAYGMKALTLNHYSNKPSLYKPQEIIAAVDKSFSSNADDALLKYPATQAFDDRNFLGQTRGNFPFYRQSEFIVGLMDGTQFGGAVDPRMTRMLSIAPDSQYRGVNVDATGLYGGLPASKTPNNLYGYPGLTRIGLPAKYVFSDKSAIPVLTYSELQFIKAEAALRAGDQATAITAYRNGIASSIDFVNARNQDDGQWPKQITAAEKAAFLADPNVVPAKLTLSHVMSQKFIALWGWGHDEIWMDLRRYHYTDMDPASGTRVFRGFELPKNLYGDNNGKVVQRLRPRYNSEYVWNRAGLDAIGGLAPDYHTKPMWITEPGS